MTSLMPQRTKHDVVRHHYANFMHYRSLAEVEGIDTVGGALSFLDLKRGLNSLEGTEKALFFGNVVADISQSDLAERFNMPKSTVQWNVAQALHSLVVFFYGDNS